METQTNRKRLHSDTEELDSPQGCKRMQLEIQDRQPAGTSEAEQFRLYHFYLENPKDPNVAPIIPSSPPTLLASGCNPSGERPNTLMQGLPHRDPLDLSSCSGEASTEGSNSMSDSDSSSPNPRALANKAASTSSPRTVSDYKDSDSSTDSESGDGSPSSRSPSPPSAFHLSAGSMPESSGLQSRLRSFLPAIQAANETLERERAEGRLGPRNIEDVDENDEQYIEMNLGLGVLEEKPAGNLSWEPADDESESETESEFQTQSGSESARETDSISGNESEKDTLSTNRGNNLQNETPKPESPKRKEPETNRLARLMGQRRPDHPATKPVIEVLPTTNGID